MTDRLRLGRNTTIGLAIAVASVLVLGWSLLGTPNPFASQHVVWAEFRNISSLIRFDRNVRLGGADVGTVGAVQRRGDTARIQLLLTASAADSLHSDATAQLRPHTLFDGNSFVQLEPGSASAPLLRGGTIPLSRTFNYVTLDQALLVFNQPTRTGLQGDFSNLAATLGNNEVRALRQTFSAAPALMATTAVAARALQGPTGTELAGSIRGFARTVSAIGKARSSIGPTLRDAAATVDAVNAAGPALQQSLMLLPATLSASESGSAALERTLVDLHPIAQELKPALAQLTPTLTEMRPVLRSLGPVLQSSPPLLSALRDTLTSAQTAAKPVGTLVQSLRPTIATIGARLIPYLLSKTPAGSTVIGALGALTAGADGALSPVETLAHAQQGGDFGAGHIFYIDAVSLVQPECASVTVPAIRSVLEALSLCSL
jgi:virulence factor Mce-like protein